MILATAYSLAQESRIVLDQWWSPGQDEVLPREKAYPNSQGMLGVINDDAPVVTDGHAFFEAIGSNGRACVTCHQPADGMSLSVATIQERWQVTAGNDPLFAAVDGSNCPHLPQDDAASHSLLLEKGLFRIPLPWPGKDSHGKLITPEFTIEVVRDPTGCNTHPEYGLQSANPTVSVYRRPRPVANMKYIASTGGFFNIKTGMPLDKDPESGRSVGMNIMSDARAATLRVQARDAARTHLERKEELSEQQLQQIVDFEMQVFMAQSFQTQAGSLSDNGATGGPLSLLEGRRGLGDDFQTPVFGYFDVWRDASAAAAETPAQQEFRESVVRGNDIYMGRSFWISDAVHINSIGLGNPIKRTCATCHNMANTGMDLAPGYVDLGTTNMPTANNMPDLPLFKLTCNDKAPPHPFLGRVIYTHDPGRALISGLCTDIGAITMQQLRGLSARAPYFANGSADSLREIVDFYDRRFNIGYSQQEKQDLVNFLSVL
ncbi:MAG: hypothetical protein H7A04_00450 [Pseudomonadales bacterium]|nr:hypothetical protein [Pseudomonadales bacterium]